MSIKNEITIVIKGGVVQEVRGMTSNLSILIHDYDIDDMDDLLLEVDDNDKPYKCTVMC